MTKKKKVTTKKKKVVKKKRVAKKTQSMVPVYVNASELLAPERESGKYSIIPTPLVQRQIQFIVAPTDPKYIQEREGKGKDKKTGLQNIWKYLPASWFKKRLNFTFGFLWDFDILGERIDGDYITVKGKLTIKDSKTLKPMIEKTDFGGHPIIYLANKPHTPQNYLDISNDFKAAASDCLKRCAVQLGFAMDVYGKNELQEMGYQIQNGNQQPVSPRRIVKTKAVVIQTTNETDYKAKLKEQAEKMAGKKFKTQTELLDFVNSKVGTKAKSIISQNHAQRLLFQLLTGQNKL